MIYRYSSRNPLGGVGCFLFGVLALVALWFILKGLYKILFWASPALIVLALIVNWRAVRDTLKNWLHTMETNPVVGLLNAALAVLLFPFFTLYLFVKALGYNKIEQMQREFGQAQRAEEEFVEFEELESTLKGGAKAEEPLERQTLPEKEPEQKSKSDRQKAKKELPEEKLENPYDQLFE
jgi:hypothetical protein